MKFRTEIDKAPLKREIDYGTEIFAVGSCFAQNIAQRLRQAKFRVVTSPTGILFNPASIAQSLTAFATNQAVDPVRIVHRGEAWVSLDCHSDLTGSSEQEALNIWQSAINEGHKRLLSASCVVITLGTAWVYEHIATGRVVANCHKIPQREFIRRRLTVTEICDLFRPLMDGILRDKQVIFTVSPVRHTADGLAENSLSKATLRLAVAELTEQFDNADYFPAYEIVIDDLRDYRFYADDLVHPSSQAIEYIWEHFIQCALSDTTRQMLDKVEKIVAAAAHRPFNPHSVEYQQFCERNLEQAKALSMIDFSDECAIFERFLNKS